ncbi:LysR family transcriptional regulator [Kibdelosporangium phytohabitans]|uniref:LysR family transcriptional regulator n=1 Tax=Kibdelosporangium phytohabitans TaxID=860235 RepID=A0A0N9IIP6_9PSEU|nr:LysR family transcriptional regulator [Kibdelosporangium phytohabitans]ALG14916.1 LysR family transcriptional regulator [Kibdelosporangium phytohabitans]MBE1469931.1 DNA-binding transcriptional LysR family regulator [Kibdelosporangium phytohabitans]
MSATDLSPGELRLLLAVERTGSFTAAAGDRGLTQSAVSHAVRVCERKIGAVLFERGRSGARVTKAGHRVLVHARQILRQLDLLVAEARGAAAGTLTGPLRIAAFRSAAAHLLPVALDRLTAEHPGLSPKVLIVPELGRGTAGEVADGRADVAIATLAEDSPPPSGLVAGELLREPYLLVHPAGHREPRGFPLIDWAENCSSYTRAWWARQDWLPEATVDVADDGVVLSMVAQGIGMAILPKLSLMTTPPSVTVTPLGDNGPTRRIVYVATHATAQSLAVRQLVTELRAAAKPHTMA